MIATGHYVRIDNRKDYNDNGESGNSSSSSSVSSSVDISGSGSESDNTNSTSSGSSKSRGKTHTPRLLKGLDITKDQSYFLSMTHVSTVHP